MRNRLIFTLALGFVAVTFFSCNDAKTPEARQPEQSRDAVTQNTYKGACRVFKGQIGARRITFLLSQSGNADQYSIQGAWWCDTNGSVVHVAFPENRTVEDTLMGREGRATTDGSNKVDGDGTWNLKLSGTFLKGTRTGNDNKQETVNLTEIQAGAVSIGFYSKTDSFKVKNNGKDELAYCSCSVPVIIGISLEATEAYRTIILQAVGADTLKAESLATFPDAFCKEYRDRMLKDSINTVLTSNLSHLLVVTPVYLSNEYLIVSIKTRDYSGGMHGSNSNKIRCFSLLDGSLKTPIDVFNNDTKAKSAVLQ